MFLHMPLGISRIQVLYILNPASVLMKVLFHTTSRRQPDILSALVD